MKNILIILLILIGVAMMYQGATAPKFMMPPFLSGVAFLLIAGLFKVKD